MDFMILLSPLGQIFICYLERATSCSLPILSQLIISELLRHWTCREIEHTETTFLKPKQWMFGFHNG